MAGDRGQPLAPATMLYAIKGVAEFYAENMNSLVCKVNETRRYGDILKRHYILETPTKT